MYGVHGYLPAPPAALLGRGALELSGAEHLPYAPGREFEDARGLIDCVVLLSFAHTGILPLPEAFAPVLGPPSAVKGVTS